MCRDAHSRSNHGSFQQLNLVNTPLPPFHSTKLISLVHIKSAHIRREYTGEKCDNNYLTDRCCRRVVEIVAPALGDQIELLTVLIQIPHGACPRGAWSWTGKMDCEVRSRSIACYLFDRGRPSCRPTFVLIAATLDPLSLPGEKKREREREREENRKLTDRP